MYRTDGEGEGSRGDGGEGVRVRVGRDELRRGGGEGEEGDPSRLHPPGEGVEALRHLPGEEAGEDGGAAAVTVDPRGLDLGRRRVLVDAGVRVRVLVRVRVW